MQPDELIDQLAGYRLDRRLAELHYHLSRLGGGRASEVARASNRKRTDVYKDLETLVGRRFATKTLERPARYLPRPLEEVLAIVLHEGRQELGLLSERATSLARAWPRAASRLEASSAQYAVHQGMAQVRGCLERLVDAAEEDILVVGPPRFAAKLRSAGILDRLAERARQGVAVRILTVIDRPDPFLAKLSATCQVRHLHFPSHAAAVCADTAAVALLVSSGKAVSSQGTQETMLLVEAADFVLGQRTLLDALWQRGIDATARWRELEEGRPAPRLEVLRGARLVADRVCAMAARAQRRLQVEADIPPGTPFIAALAAAAEGAAARGVQVTGQGSLRIAVQAPVQSSPTVVVPPPDAIALRLEERNTATARPPAPGTRCQVNVDVDGVEFAFAWRTAGDPDGEGECWAIWTNDATLGRRLAADHLALERLAAA